MLVLVRGFSYTPRDSYCGEFYTLDTSFSEVIFMSVLVIRFSYIFYVCLVQWGVSIRHTSCCV